MPGRCLEGAWKAHGRRIAGAWEIDMEPKRQSHRDRHEDTEAQRHEDTEPESHRDRDTETWSHRDMDTQRQREPQNTDKIHMKPPTETPSRPGGMRGAIE